MKKTIIMTLLALSGLTQAVAQDYEYVPFVREGVKWVYWYSNDFSYGMLDMPSGINYWTFEMKGDTVIGGKHYMPVRLASLDYNLHETLQDFTPVCLREEGKVVYAVCPDGENHSQCPAGIGLYVGSSYNRQKAPEGEFVLYDFNDPVALYDSVFYEKDHAQYDHETKHVRHLGTDTVVVGGRARKRHHYKGIYNNANNPRIDYQDVIEGIGYDGYGGFPLFYFEELIPGFQVHYGLSHVIEDGEIVYSNATYGEKMHMPLNREGVQWVNELVTVNGGDTVCHYYTYQTRGLYPGMPFTACYRYDGKGARDGEDGLLTAGLEDLDGCVYSYRNTVLAQAIGEDRNMMSYAADGDTHIIYDGLMGFSPVYGTSDYLPRFYMESQREPMLTDENFMRVAPVVIESCLCNRWAYVDGQGDTLAYVVEGIGFDSRDMGDLLTPFTRKPDPAADHQEYCGLSHVIKDGKIIYKGMRYRNDGFHGLDEAVCGQTRRQTDDNYYNLMGQPVGKDVPSVPGIYIRQGKKVCVSRGR